MSDDLHHACHAKEDKMQKQLDKAMKELPTLRKEVHACKQKIKKLQEAKRSSPAKAEGKRKRAEESSDSSEEDAEGEDDPDDSEAEEAQTSSSEAKNGKIRVTAPLCPSHESLIDQDQDIVPSWSLTRKPKTPKRPIIEVGNGEQRIEIKLGKGWPWGRFRDHCAAHNVPNWTKNVGMIAKAGTGVSMKGRLQKFVELYPHSEATQDLYATFAKDNPAHVSAGRTGAAPKRKRKSQK